MARGLSLAALLLAAAPHTAAAHAFLKRSVPAANSTVAPPAELRLIFGSALEPGRGLAKVTVLVDGRKLTGLPEAVTGEDGTTVRLALPAPKPGAYTVHWSVVAHDGHRTSGSFGFVAKPE